MRSRVLKQGKSWRIGFNPEAEFYQGLVGGQDWAIELTFLEWQDFCRLVMQLSETMKVMAAELMDEEKIVCEAESDLIWLEVAGYYHSYSLRFILNQGRCCEGSWAAEIVPEFIQSLQTFTI